MCLDKFRWEYTSAVFRRKMVKKFKSSHLLTKFNICNQLYKPFFSSAAAGAAAAAAAGAAAPPARMVLNFSRPETK